MSLAAYIALSQCNEDDRCCEDDVEENFEDDVEGE
jgi:hypothetical protein